MHTAWGLQHGAAQAVATEQELWERERASARSRDAAFSATRPSDMKELRRRAQAGSWAAFVINAQKEKLRDMRETAEREAAAQREAAAAREALLEAPGTLDLPGLLAQIPQAALAEAAHMALPIGVAKLKQVSQQAKLPPVPLNSDGSSGLKNIVVVHAFAALGVDVLPSPCGSRSQSIMIKVNRLDFGVTATLALQSRLLCV